jgi:catechol 2,3-dioxygenase-like lactoylglutathione lyase family enzyme
MIMEINGIAHVHITVNNLQKAILFYEKVLGFMGMFAAVKVDQGIYMIGGRTAIAITRSTEKNRSSQFDQMRIGLHHLCFRARSREDIDQLHEYLKSIEAPIIHPPEEGPWAPGYYSILFEDPDGIRLEVNYVPKEGLLALAKQLPLKTFPGYENYPK